MEDVGLATLAVWHVMLREAVLIAAVGVGLSSLDDVFIDLVFILRVIWRRLFVYTRHDRATVETLRRPDPAAIAIIVPAWDEADVIGAMLADLTRRLDYPRYRVFVGVYPNDPRGITAVQGVADHHIQMVICSRPGPTTKADCLNHLWAAVTAHERSTEIPFKAVVLHDAEDVIHAQELWIYDALIPKLAMVQLPVLPLPDTRSRWISGHYLDEFAENHIKDMVVREALGAAVPSAGVATAIDRHMLGRIADAAAGAPFEAACLTEDYEIGYRIRALGGRGALVRIKSGNERMVVATREHFPATFQTALRQKTRWLTGIALSGWDRLGWPGGIADRYMLLRDRKALAASLVTMFAYAVGLMIVVDMGLRATVPTFGALPPLIPPWLAVLLWCNAAMLLWRLLLRAAFTAHNHGPTEGLRAIPRAVVSNIINAAAAWTAARRYYAIIRGTAELKWDKTAHRFPGQA